MAEEIIDKTHKDILRRAELLSENLQRALSVVQRLEAENALLRSRLADAIVYAQVSRFSIV